MKSNYLTQGEIIKQARKDKGLSAKKLAELLGVTPSAVTQWEKNTTGVSISSLLALSIILGLDKERFLKAEGPTNMKLETTPWSARLTKLDVGGVNKSLSDPKTKLDILKAINNAMNNSDPNSSATDTAENYSLDKVIAIVSFFLEHANETDRYKFIAYFLQSLSKEDRRKVAQIVASWV